MMETALCAAFIFVFGWHCGRIHRDHQLSRKTADGIKALLSSEWYGEERRGELLHFMQDVVGELPEVPVVVRFGPEEPRWWMRYVRNNGVSG